MEIHELNNFNGTPGATNYLAIDDGSDTSRISGTDLLKPVNGRIDGVLEQNKETSVLLGAGSFGASGGTITLSKSLADYDFVEVIIPPANGFQGSLRERANFSAFAITLPRTSGGDFSSLIDTRLDMLKFTINHTSNTSLTVSVIRIWSWDQNRMPEAYIQDYSGNVTIQIWGIRYAQLDATELTDLRTAHNGTVYSTARAAREADYNALESKADTFNQNSIDRDNDIKRNLQNGLDQMGNGLIIYTGFEWEVGTIQGGADIYNTKTYRTKGYYPTANVDYVESLDNDCVGRVYYYTDAQGTYANDTTPFNSIDGFKQSINKNYPYYRVIYAKADYSVLPNLDNVILYKVAEFQNDVDELLEDVAISENNIKILKEATTVEVERAITHTELQGKLLNRDGSVVDFSNLGWRVSEPIDITECLSLVVTASSGYNHLLYAFYDSDNNFISGLDSGSGLLAITDEAVAIPKDATYFRMSKNASTGMSLKGVYLAPKSSESAKWAGKKWTVVGDSLTAVNSRTTKHYFDYVAEETGISVVNMGDSGSGYRAEQDGGTAFYQRIVNVPTDSDVVTIFGSFNDGITDLGTATDSGTTTVGGCVNACIDALYSVMPTVQLGIVSPTPWIGANPYNHPEANAYADLLEAICKRRSIPFLNLYYESNLRPWDATFRQLAYSKDDGNGVHPDETGHKIIASRFEGFLDSLLL